MKRRSRPQAVQVSDEQAKHEHKEYVEHEKFRDFFRYEIASLAVTEQLCIIKMYEEQIEHYDSMPNSKVFQYYGVRMSKDLLIAQYNSSVRSYKSSLMEMHWLGQKILDVYKVNPSDINSLIRQGLTTLSEDNSSKAKALNKS